MVDGEGPGAGEHAVELGVGHGVVSNDAIVSPVAVEEGDGG